jgi:RimJ/RimL family protein N-acetyltransferase
MREVFLCINEFFLSLEQMAALVTVKRVIACLEGATMLRSLCVGAIMVIGQSLATRMDCRERPSTTHNEKVAMLETLSPNEYKSAEAFFTDFTINEPFLYSILDGKTAGHVVTDNRDSPSFVLVYDAASHAFLSGNLDQSSLNAVAAYLKSLPRVSLVCPPDWDYRAYFENNGFTPIERIQFRKPKELRSFESWEQRLPPQYRMANICDENLERCQWGSFVSAFFGSTERFYSHGHGFCVIDKERVLSESYGIIARGKAEIGVITDANYRGQNLGTIACASMLHYCYDHNLEPFWSCDADNYASAKIAKKLLFEEDCRYVYLKSTQAG